MNEKAIDKTINQLIDEAAKTLTVNQHNDTDIHYTLIKYTTVDGFSTTSLPIAVLVAINAIIYPIIEEKYRNIDTGGMVKETNFVLRHDGA